jgi:hypothetical protein
MMNRVAFLFGKFVSKKNEPLNQQLLRSLTGKAVLKKHGGRGADSYQFPETNGAMGRAALLRRRV